MSVIVYLKFLMESKELNSIKLYVYHSYMFLFRTPVTTSSRKTYLSSSFFQ